MTIERATQGTRQVMRWSVADYERIVALGGFAPDKRIELIEGEITEAMPQKPAHRLTLSLILPIALGWCSKESLYHVLCQAPIKLAQSMPEPDIAIIMGHPRDFSDTHPTTAALIIEVSDTTLEYDQTVKARIYAAAEIPDYWIVDLNARTIEVRRDPEASSYQSLHIFTETETVAPLFNADARITVAELLP
jgi:Uma2 family endonuclease